MSQKKIPVTIITGCLGAGKTSLVNLILSENTSTRFAIIENEFGEIGIDQEIITDSGAPDITELTNGCICCTVRKDLITALTALLEKGGFDHLLIETTGLAEPGPVAQILIAYNDLNDKFNLNAVITIADAEYIMDNLNKDPVAVQQIGFADILVLNKIGSNPPKRLEEIEKRLTGINSEAILHKTEYARIDTASALAFNGFSSDKALAMDPDFFNPHQSREDPFFNLMNRMPSYHDEIRSIGIEVTGEMDEKKIDAWLTFLTSIQGEDILRLKGVISIKGLNNRLIIQGVHSTLTADISKPWGDSPRVNRLLFIGRFLDRGMLEKEFKSCLV